MQAFTTARRRALAASAVVLGVAGLAACSPPNENDSSVVGNEGYTTPVYTTPAEGSAAASEADHQLETEYGIGATGAAAGGASAQTGAQWTATVALGDGTQVGQITVTRVGDHLEATGHLTGLSTAGTSNRHSVHLHQNPCGTAADFSQAGGHIGETHADGAQDGDFTEPLVVDAAGDASVDLTTAGVVDDLQGRSIVIHGPIAAGQDSSSPTDRLACGNFS